MTKQDCFAGRAKKSDKSLLTIRNWRIVAPATPELVFPSQIDLAQ
jgi:hypothetical protein